MSNQFIEIFDFTHFFEHFVFVSNERNMIEKRLMSEIHVKVGIELVTGNM